MHPKMAAPPSSHSIDSKIPVIHRSIPDVKMEVYCHCDGWMRMVSYEEFDNRVEQRFECTECDEIVMIVKDRKWEETLPGD
jgi:hypothetical protein